jgi:hypothetical protein
MCGFTVRLRFLSAHGMAHSTYQSEVRFDGALPIEFIQGLTPEVFRLRCTMRIGLCVSQSAAGDARAPAIPVKALSAHLRHRRGQSRRIDGNYSR